jgi:hypothetical protein
VDGAPASQRGRVYRRLECFGPRLQP